MASSGGDHACSERAVKVASAAVPRSRHRLPAPHQLLLCLSTLVHCLYHRSNWVAPTWSWHRPRGLRSYEQGGPLLHHMPLTHAPCLACAPPAAPRTRARPLGPFGSINGCCWRWTDTWSWLDTSAPWRPRDGSTQLPRWPEAKCCQNPRERLPFSTTITAIIAIKLPYPPPIHPWPRTGTTRWSKTKREL